MENVNFKDMIRLSETMNNQLQNILNIVYPVVGAVLILSIIIPAIIFYVKKIMFKSNNEPSALLKNWVSTMGSVLVLMACYGVISAINLLVIKPQIDVLNEISDDLSELRVAIKTMYMVIANICFSIIIALAQLAALINYIVWISKKSAGNSEDTAALLKSIFWIVFITVILVFAILAANLIYDNYLKNELVKIANSQ